MIEGYSYCTNWKILYEYKLVGNLIRTDFLVRSKKKNLNSEVLFSSQIRLVRLYNCSYQTGQNMPLSSWILCQKFKSCMLFMQFYQLSDCANLVRTRNCCVEKLYNHCNMNYYILRPYSPESSSDRKLYKNRMCLGARDVLFS